MSKYGVSSGPNAGKYGPEETPYLDTFHHFSRSAKTAGFEGGFIKFKKKISKGGEGTENNEVIWSMAQLPLFNFQINS